MTRPPASPMETMPWEFMETDDWQWFNATTFGSGVARALAGWILAHTGGEPALGLHYPSLVREFEFTEKLLRGGVARLTAHGHARIMPASSLRGIYPEGADDVLLLLTPSRRKYEAHQRQLAEERAARRAAKIAARGGQVNRKAIPDVVKARVYARDNFTCVKCGATEDLTLDHIKPWSTGGPDTENNLRVLCRSCNSRKGDRAR